MSDCFDRTEGLMEKRNGQLTALDFLLAEVLLSSVEIQIILIGIQIELHRWLG